MDKDDAFVMSSVIATMLPARWTRTKAHSGWCWIKKQLNLLNGNDCWLQIWLKSLFCNNAIFLNKKHIYIFKTGIANITKVVD